VKPLGITAILLGILVGRTASHPDELPHIYQEVFPSEKPRGWELVAGEPGGARLTGNQNPRLKPFI
jgi:hypothetical protein